MAGKYKSSSVKQNQGLNKELKVVLTDQCNNVKEDRSDRKRSVPDDFDDEDSGKENAISINSTKRVNTELLEELREQDITKLNKVVTMSMKYSAYLEQKISTANPGSSNSTSDSLPSSQVSIRRDILDRMKYFKGTLRPYQEEGVTWLTVLFENSINGILGDEMGLGKTIQIIALLCHLYERKVPGPFLIVVPLSTLSNWEAEFQRFAPEIPVCFLQGDPDRRQSQMKIFRKIYKLGTDVVKPVLVTTYEGPKIEPKFFNLHSWEYIIVDEGHRLKNPKSRLSIQLMNIKSTNRLLLTGTPLQNSIQELWALLHFLMPGLFKDRNGLSALLELDELKDKMKLLENEANSQLISKIHRTLSPFILRRQKKYVLKELPPKKEIDIYCRLTEMQRYLYIATLHRDYKKLTMVPLNENEEITKRTSVKANYFGVRSIKKRPVKAEAEGSRKNVPFDIPDTEYRTNIKLQNPLMMLRKTVNHPFLIWCPLKPNSKGKEMYVSEEIISHSGKLQVLDAMLPILKEQDHKILLFSTSVMFLDLIEEMLIIRKYKYERLDGSRTFDDRSGSIDSFNNNKDIFIFMISTRAGGLGLNLSSADTVIFMDRDWNPMVDLQAQDRCHRIGQTKPVMIYSLITKGTVDEIVVNRSTVKKRLEKIILQEGKFETMGQRNFNDDQLKELEEILSKEERHVTVRPNGLIYSEEELRKILDRRDLYRQMKK